MGNCFKKLGSAPKKRCFFVDAKDIFGLVFGGWYRWFQSCQLPLSFGNRLVRQFARCRPQQHRHHHQCLCHLLLQPGVSLLRWVGWTWYKSKRMNTLLQTYSWHLKHGDWKMSFLLGRHPARCPSSQNHGSVENGYVSKIRFLSFRVIFHWTVIMGERVLYCSSWNIIWPPVTPLDTVELVQDFQVLWFLCIFTLRRPRFFFGRRLPLKKGIFQPFNPNFFHLW